MSNTNNYPNGLIAALSGTRSAPPPPPQGLLGLLRRPEVQGLYYNRQKIVLDGYRFIGCRFDNCTLEVSSLNFDLIRCVIDPSTVISYGPSVAKIIQLFNGRYDWASRNFTVPFVPVKNDDGTITISDSAV